MYVSDALEPHFPNSPLRRIGISGYARLWCLCAPLLTSALVIGSILSNLCKRALPVNGVPLLTGCYSACAWDVFLRRWYEVLRTGLRYQYVSFRSDLLRTPVAVILLLTCIASPRFLTGVTQLNSTLLMMSVIALLIPAAFHFTAGEQIEDPTEAKDILSVSHGVR